MNGKRIFVVEGLTLAETEEVSISLGSAHRALVAALAAAGDNDFQETYTGTRYSYFAVELDEEEG